MKLHETMKEYFDKTNGNYPGNDYWSKKFEDAYKADVKANPVDLLVRLPLNLWWAFNIGRDKQEPEKALLPALIIINSKSFPEFEHVSGYMFALGWWDWSVKFGIFHKRSA